MFSQVKQGRLSLKNRFIRSAIWEEQADDQGHLNPKLIQSYVTLAENQVALLITGGIAVSEQDWPLRQMLSLHQDQYIAEHQELTCKVHEQKAQIWAQLTLGGNNIYKTFRKKAPIDYSLEEIKALTNDFAQAARRAEAAGYDGIQIQAAHGLLLSRFLSPKENTRKDEYGENNRLRFLQEIFAAVKAAVSPEFLVSVKINSQDFTKGGLEESESLQFCQAMDAWGVDSIQVSGNTPSRLNMSSRDKEAYFAGFARQLAELIDTPIILAGGLKHLETLEEILANSKIQLFALGRPLLCENWLLKRWMGGDREPAKCVYCNNCFNMPDHLCICNHKWA